MLRRAPARAADATGGISGSRSAPRGTGSTVPPSAVVGRSSDPQEHAADALANVVVPSAGTAAGQAPTGDPLGGSAAPGVVGAVVGGSGRSLDAATRGWFAERSGRELPDVRIHDDGLAATSASQLGARAYTVGNHIAFARGQFDSTTEAGRWLLAHELAHVVADGGDRAVRRACVISPLPPAVLPIGAADPFRYQAAEKCLQAHYAQTHPGSTQGVNLSFNLDWVMMTGSTPNERAALRCLKGHPTSAAGPSFTGRSGMVAGEPDLWDFHNQTMYEITTSNGAPYRIGKLRAELAQANAITSTMDCGGVVFDPGTWTPAGPLMIDSGLYITVTNNTGVLIYQVWRDVTKELTAVMLALIAAALKNSLKAGAKKLAGRAVPAYAIASLAAVAIMLASGKAQAKAGPGDEEPLAQLFKALEQEGIPVTPEFQRLIDADPALKQKLSDAATGKASPTEAQKAVMEATMKLIEANPDQFSQEDLETLLTAQQAATGAGVPGAPESAEELRRMIDAVKHGHAASSVKSGTGSGTGGPGGQSPAPTAPPPTTPAPPPTTPAPTPPPATATTPAEGAKALAAVTGPRRQVLDTLLSKTTGVDATPVITQLIAVLPADLTDAEASQLIAQVSSAPPASPQAALAALQAAVGKLRAPKTIAPATPEADEKAKLTEAARKVPAGFPAGKFESGVPDDPQPGQTYHVQILGRSSQGNAYAASASVKLDSVSDKLITGRVVASTAGFGTDGTIVLAENGLAGQKVSRQGSAGKSPRPTTVAH